MVDDISHIKDIVQTNGLIFNGIQETKNPEIKLFIITDPSCGSTLSVNALTDNFEGDLKKNLKRMRDAFRR